MTRPERNCVFWMITFLLTQGGKNLFQCPGNGQTVSVPARAGSAYHAKKQIELLASGKLDNGMVFAFDHIKDKELIERKLELLREVIPISYHKVKLYVLCGYDWDGTWLPDFWAADIRDVFERIKILMQYGCLAYLMRYEAWLRAPETYKGMYINLSRWCNQPAQYVKKAYGNFVPGREKTVPVSDIWLHLKPCTRKCHIIWI